MTSFSFIKIVTLTGVLLSLPGISYAAMLSLTANPPTTMPGGLVEVEVAVSSDSSVNAYSGSLVYPQSVVPVAVSDGNSIVSAWIDHPTITSGGIAFQGITPGGFSGRQGILFSVIFQMKTAGTEQLSLDNVTVLLNDGLGTPTEVSTSPLSILVSTNATTTFVNAPDTIPPEPFAVYLNKDPSLYGGQSYVVFSAVDKGSGIDHYEVAESRWPLWLVPLSWQTTSSPYVLADQYETSTVYIKAVDREGNARIVIFPRQHLLRPYEEIILIGMLLIGILLWWWMRRSKGGLHSI